MAETPEQPDKKKPKEEAPPRPRMLNRVFGHKRCCGK